MRAGGTSLPTILQVQEAAARAFNVPLSVMREPDGSNGSRSRERARPRQAAMALAALLTERHLTTIGRHFGGRDHTTVIEACRRVAVRRRSDPELDSAMKKITREVVGRGLCA